MNYWFGKKRWTMVMAMSVGLLLLTSSLLTGCGQKTETPPQPPAATNQAPEVPIALYDGADREQKLVEAAKKEGKLTVYGSMAVEDMQPVLDAFQAKYGIKAELWRAGSEDVLNRSVTEARAGKYVVDVVETNGPEMEALYREKLLAEVKSPKTAELMPEALFAHKSWVATRLNIFVQAWNTNKVKQEDLPKTYQDLLDPKWKGRLAIEAEDMDYFAAIVKEMGEEQGLKYWRDLVSTNGVNVRKGHTLLAQLVASGEVPFALTVYSYKVDQLKTKDKAPVDWFALAPAIARPNGVGVAKNAPNPNAAVLFYDFMLTEGQKVLTDRNMVVTNTKYQPDMKGMKLKFVDSAIVLDELDKWTKLFDEIIIKKSPKFDDVKK